MFLHSNLLRTLYLSSNQSLYSFFLYLQPVVEETVEIAEVPVATSYVSVDEDVTATEEPASPASSILSCVSESGSKSGQRKAKGKQIWLL